ncbi:condensation domain-containing protein [Actinomadura sp. 3N407]|uniref:condensation domain-containing protein n=1 Tax=Actinomadura sp. 3N407 TaxID=3457423 RepID=UPI003FCCABA8
MTGSGETAELPLTAGQLQHFAVIRRNPALRMAIWSCFRLPGELDVDRLTDSVETLVSRHEALRVEILERPGGEPRQRIRDLPPRAGLISCQSVLARSEEQFSRYVRHILVQEVRREWGGDAYPFKFRLFRYSPTVHTLMVGFSHMAVDGIGADLLIHDLLRTYADAAAGRTPRGLPRRGFADSVSRQSEAIGGGRRSTGRDRPDPSPPTRFDVPPPDPGEDGGQSRQSTLSLSGTELAALREQADLHGCTEFTWILAAFARTVFRFTRQDRISISVPVDMRGPGEREVVGMYVLEVPVVVERPRDTGDARGLVAGVGSAVLRAMVRARRSRTWGDEFGPDLSINYRKMSALDGRAAGRLSGAQYLPRIDYLTPGMSLLAFSYPDVLDVQALLDSGVFSADAEKDVTETLRRDLTSGSSR